jgi:flagella basal body P-ring formation protein FlgA
MNPMKQTLCRRWLNQACRACVWLILAGGLAHVGWAAAAKNRSEPKPASVSPEEQLTQSVTQWVGRQQGVRPDQVQLQPLDPRVRVQACARALNMDLPFSSTETVRVRCPEPVWQLYVRVQNGAPDARQGWNAPTGGAPVGEQRRQVLVTSTHLSRGMTLQAQDVRLATVAVPASAGTWVDNPAEILHAEVLRDLPAGTPLRRSDLRPSILVKRGQLVQLSVGQSRGFMVSARVEAMQDGRMGEQIKLRNPESGRLLTGVVKGPNAVEGL